MEPLMRGRNGVDNGAHVIEHARAQTPRCSNTDDIKLTNSQTREAIYTQQRAGRHAR